MAKGSFERPTMSDAEIAAVPVGEQPEEDGLLACLECGRWYRGLGGHVAFAHEMSADDYRLRHELPRGRGLWAEDARRAAGERSAKRAGRYPKAVKTRLTGDAEQVEVALAAQRESWQRAGTRAALRANWADNSQRMRARTRDRYQQMAEAAGYESMDALMEQVKDLPTRELAQILQIPLATAKKVRRVHAADYNFDHVPAGPEPWSPAQLAAVAPGDQPIVERFVLCRMCGKWLQGLARHVSVKHEISLDGYRRAFELPDGIPVVPPAIGRANQEAVAERRDRAAQALGYADLQDLVRRTRELPQGKVAKMMGVASGSVRLWRERWPGRLGSR